MSSNDRPRFHLAFPVHDIEVTRRFWVDVLGCRVGRSDERWIDFDFEGHQISAHLVERRANEAFNPVDGDQVPIPHFGLILEWKAWHALADRLCELGTKFVIEPHVRFDGGVGEQATMFLRDPSGNALEFKSFQDERAIFAH